MTKKIFFDLDGTVADLYGYPDWLKKLRSEEKGVFQNLSPLHNMNILNKVLEQMVKNGWQIEVITWLPMGASEEYRNQCTIEKKEWLARYMPIVETIHAVEYGTPKHKINYKHSRLELLIDDNKEVINEWVTNKQRQAIEANDNLISNLIQLMNGTSKV